MAVSDAVRRGGSLLLRTLAVGGLATAAWLACAGVASASAEDHSDEVAHTLETANLALDERQAEADALLTDALLTGPVLTDALLAGAFPQLSFTDHGRRPAEGEYHSFHVPVEVEGQSAEDEHDASPEAYHHSSFSSPSISSSSSDDAGYTHSGHVSSGYSNTGSVSNTMPAPMYEAKVAAKAAVRAAAEATPAPPAPNPASPEVVTEPTLVVALPFAPAAPEVPSSDVTSDHEVTWQAPEPGAPAPAPQQAPAPSAPTASSGSSSTDNGGGQRGGVNASFAGQSALLPPTSWSVERRDDDRSPGSVPGLPSTSPD